MTLDPIGVVKMYKTDFESFCKSQNVTFNVSNFNDLSPYDKIYYSITGDPTGIQSVNQYHKNMNHMLSEYKAYNKSIQQYVFYYKYRTIFKIIIFVLMFIMTIILKG